MTGADHSHERLGAQLFRMLQEFFQLGLALRALTAALHQLLLRLLDHLARAAPRVHPHAYQLLRAVQRLERVRKGGQDSFVHGGLCEERICECTGLIELVRADEGKDFERCKELARDSRGRGCGSCAWGRRRRILLEQFVTMG